LLVNGRIVSTSEATSSPSHINATRGSSVWLHWDYTYIGDGRHGRKVHFTSKYEEQIIGINSTSQPKFQALAKRIGQNGALRLESPLPAPFNGRVKVISSNSTLVIYDLQYADALYYFVSDVNVHINIGAGHGLHDFPLKPIISLSVKGIPEFITEPTSEVEVKEGSLLELEICMEGNPKPKAYFKWTHLSTLSVVNVFMDSSPYRYHAEYKRGKINANNCSRQLQKPFRYYAEYKFDNVDASYCGRQLQTTLKNRFGSSPTKFIRVFVLLNLDKPLNLTAKRSQNSSCFEVKWRRIESAACNVTYVVALKDKHGKDINESSGTNVGEATVCSALQHVNVAVVQLTVKFRKMSRTLTVFVAEKKYRLHKETSSIPYTSQRSRTTQTPTQKQILNSKKKLSNYAYESNAASSLGLNVIIIIFIVSLIMPLVVTILVFLRYRRKRTSDKRQREPGTETHARDNYMDLLPRRNVVVPIYAGLENEYEEIEELSI